MSYELKLPPLPPTINAITGKFLKGHIPHNKGKKWSEWMDGRKAKRVLKGLKRTGNPNIGGWQKKRIVAIKDGKLCGVFEHSVDAENKTGICARNIRNVCNGKRKKAGKYQWFYENSNEWIKLII